MANTETVDISVSSEEESSQPGQASQGTSGNVTLFSHLHGHEEQLRLEEKYLQTELGYSGEENDSCSVSENGISDVWLSSPTPSSKISPPRPVRKQKRKDKGPVHSENLQSYSATKTPETQKRANLHDLWDDIVNRPDNTDTSTNGDIATPSSSKGFSDEDLEKPNLKYTPTSAKEPFLLSESGESPVIQVPGTINQYLRDYQRDGIRFLYQHHRTEDGALLGDDMGLGKTVQVIAYMAAILGKTGTKQDVLRQRPRFIRKLSEDKENDKEDESKPRQTFLIIGPASVIYNWVDELETWGHFTVGKYHRNYKADTLADLRKGKLDVVVTTFETCRDHIDELNTFMWCAVIADEVHKIKGLKAEVTNALKKINCDRRFGLTGTALQNNLCELWCLLDWANPGCLGNVTEFNDKFAKTIEKGQKHDATKRELAVARKAKAIFSEMKSKWMLRRTKSLIADQLPNKDELVVYCKPTNFQLGIYKEILNQDDMKLILLQNDPCDCGSGKKKIRCCYKQTQDGRPVSVMSMVYMSLLLKASNHIALLLPTKTSSDTQKKYATEVCEKVFTSYPEFVQESREASFGTLSDPKYCGKMKVLQGLLSVFKKQRCKVLLFSNSVRLLDILEQFAISKGYEYRRLDGKTPEVKRIQRVREFNSDQSLFLFLISIKAGGVGLNMTGANVVIIFDPNWNPTHELQAQDRAYRIGQGRDVRVYRLISVGTIEENMYLRQIYKQQLDKVAIGSQNAVRYFHGIAGDKENPGELFGINNLFTLRTGDKCLTEDILQRNDKIEAGIKGFDISRYVPSTCETEQKSEDDPGVSQFEDMDVESDEEDQKQRNGSKQDRESDRQDFPDFYDEICSQIIEDFESDHDGGHEDRDISSSHKINPKKNHSSKMKNTDINTSTGSPKPSTSKADTKSKNKHSPNNKVRSPADRKTGGIKKSASDSSMKCQRTRMGNIEEMPSEDSDRGDDGRNLRRSSKESTNVRKISCESPAEEMPQTFASVSDVFTTCGVVHLHENKKVVGGSRAEDHMTKCAVAEVFEFQQNTQQPAMNCDPLSESSSYESDDLGENRKEKPKPKRSAVSKVTTPVVKRISRTSDPSRPRSLVIGNKKVLIGQTPKAIRLQHFGNLMKKQNFQDKVSFAEKVLASSTEEREEMLRDFYVSQDAQLEEVFVKSEPVERTLPKSSVKRGRKPGPTKAKDTKPNRRSKNEKKSQRGLHFEDSDSAPSGEDRTNRTERADEDPRIIELGEKIRKARQTRTRRRATDGRTKGVSVKDKNPTAKASSSSRQTESEEELENEGQEAIHADQMQLERGAQTSDNSVATIQKEMDHEDKSMSFLDSIFSKETRQRCRTKPPPKRLKQQKEDDFLNDIENSLSSSRSSSQRNFPKQKLKRTPTIYDSQPDEGGELLTPPSLKSPKYGTGERINHGKVKLVSDTVTRKATTVLPSSGESADAEYDWLFSSRVGRTQKTLVLASETLSSDKSQTGVKLKNSEHSQQVISETAESF